MAQQLVAARGEFFTTPLHFVAAPRRPAKTDEQVFTTPPLRAKPAGQFLAMVREFALNVVNLPAAPELVVRTAGELLTALPRCAEMPRPTSVGPSPRPKIAPLSFVVVGQFAEIARRGHSSPRQADARADS